MFNIRFKTVLCMSLAVLFSNFCFSQENLENSNLLAKEYAHKLYFKAIGHGALIYNGAKYVDFDRSVRGHQYYLVEDWEEGDIIYRDQLYHNIPFLYDIITDDLVIGHYDNNGYFTKIKLDKSKISSFNFLDNNFIHFRKDSTYNNAPRSGFYHVLYDGSMDVLARREKALLKSTEDRQLIKEINITNKYYILNDKTFIPVRSKGALLKSFGTYKKDVKKYIKSFDLTFSQNKEVLTIEAVKYYDKISNKGI